VVTLAPTLAMPLFVIHDRGDAEIPWQHGMAITRAWRGADLLMTEGLGHRRILSPSWPPPAYPVGSRLPWRKRRRPRRLSVSSWSSSKSRLATTTGRLPLFGRADAVLVQGTVTFNRDRKRIIALAAKHQLPAIYEWRMAAISSSTRWPASPPDNSLFRSGNARALAVRRDCRAADREPVVAGAPA